MDPSADQGLRVVFKRRTVLVGGSAMVCVLAVVGWLVVTRGAPADGATPGEGRSDGSAARDQQEAGTDRRSSGRYDPRIRPTSAVSATVARDPAAGQGVLEGMVLSRETNEPIANAELTFARGEVVSSAMTDRAGGFLFRATQTGTHELATVTAEGFLPFAPEWGHSPIRLEARSGYHIRDIVIHLETAVDYDGRVVSPGGQPVSDAEVMILTMREGQTALAPLPERFVSDRNGSFRFQAPLGALLEGRHEGYAPGRVRIDGRVRYHRRVTIELQPGSDSDDDGESIGGQVVDANGRAIEGALVVARFAGRPRHGPPTSSQALSDDGGVFVLGGLDVGRYHLTATADGWSPARRPAVPTGQDDVMLTLNEGATLSGVVTDSRTGEAVPGFSVVVESRFDSLRRATYRTEAFFDAEGRYEMLGLEPRDYDVYVSSHGYARSDGVQVSVDEGRRSARADFTLSRGGSASGVVLDSDSGQPVGEAQVSLEAPTSADSTPVPITARTVTDWNGRFDVHGLGAGRRTLVVTARGYHRRLITGLEVTEDGALGPLRVELSPTEEGEDPSYELTGIGAVLTARRDALMVVRVLDGGGAAEVGLGPGDTIFWVDGQPVTDLGFAGAIERIRGQEGTSVRLSIRRANGEELEITVPRRHVRG